MKKIYRNKFMCLLLAAVMMCTAGYALPGLSINASAAGTPTSFGLAEHGIKAYRDGWLYQSGGKGESGSGGVRVSDCAGLIYAYFSDIKAIGSCGGGATTQVTSNCVFSGDLDELDGIPRIHGLVVTMPDYNDPGTGIYGHIGIYLGNGEAVDNSSYNENMKLGSMADRGGWNAWHVFGNGMKYPSNGWYSMNGKMYHYTSYQYDINTEVDGYVIGKDGVALGADGKALPVDNAMKNDGYVSASTIADYLRSLGYDGKDNTHDLIYNGGGPSDPGGDITTNGKITGDGVNVRSSSTTKSTIVTTLSKGSRINIVEEVDGEKVTLGDKSSSRWYAVMTPAGHSGYVSTLLAEKTNSSGALTTPVIASDGGYVTLTTQAEGADIYYTTDNTQPDENSTPYTGPVYLVGYTYKAVAVKDGKKSGVATATVLSNGSVFTDFTAKDWFFNQVDAAVSNSIFVGSGDNKFEPNSKITRAQFIKALANLSGVDLTQYEGKATGFKDVPAKSWYTPAVAWAVSEGIISGYSDKTFHPGDLISREQMCLILATYSGLERVSGSDAFADDSKISSWAKDAVYACRDNALITGMGNNKFEPKDTAIRAQACVVLVNYRNLY